MANKKLSKYIRKQLKEGFDRGTITEHLLNYGYSVSDVDDAFRQINRPEVKHVIHFSPTAMIGIVIAFIGVVGASFFLYNFADRNVPETLLDLNLEKVTTTANAGSEMVFISEIDNLGLAKRYDVNLRYELISLATNEMLTFKDETRAIETKGSKQIKIAIPVNAPGGSYVLRAIATYNGQKAVATLPIAIEGSLQKPLNETPEIEETIKEPVREPEEETVEDIDDDIKIQEIEKESAQDYALTTFETLKEVGEIAQQDRRHAERLCEELQLQTSKDLCFNKMGEVLGDRMYCGKAADERTKDVCLSNVAKIVGKSEICEEISKDSRKDSCYMNFVIDKKDYSVCDKVVNQYLKQSCESLRQLSELNITTVGYYEGLLNESSVEFV